jgi:hypothetical protein
MGRKTPLGFTMLTTICFQWMSMLSIYHPFGCHLKGKAIKYVMKNHLFLLSFKKKFAT